jgi:hypothetical protein
MKCTDVPRLLKDLVASAALVASWQDSHETAVSVSRQYVALATSLPTPSDNQRAQLEDIKGKLIATWTHLWRGMEATNFDVGPGSDLDAAIQAIEGLRPTPVIKSLIGSPTESLLTITPAKKYLTSIASLPADTFALNLPPNDSQRIAMLERALVRSDRVSVFFASIVAVLTGLNSNYFGKPWGSLQDYVVLFLWAAGTKIGLDVISAVTDKFLPPSRAA